ncbi:MAG: flagellar basal body rod C-terminal domain-containing protein [Pseudomonadota bacterium]
MAISALSAGLSGLQANQGALDIKGQNIANAGSAGFQPQGVAFQDNPGGGGVTLSALGRSQAAAAGPANGVDLATEITESLVYQQGFDLSAKVVKAADERIGTLINISA